MPRLHPRQRLRRELIAVLGAGCALIAAAAWWACCPPTGSARRTAAPVSAAGPGPTATAAAPPAGRLWVGAAVAPAAAAPPPPPPGFRLLTLSKRGDAWIALIDPGGGGATQRVGAGDSVGGWQVGQIDGSQVVLREGGREVRLGLQP